MNDFTPLSSFRRRYHATLAVQLALEGLAWLSGACALLFLIGRWFALPWALWLAPVGLSLGWVVYRWRTGRRDLFAIAQDMDHRHQLKERLATACELAQQGRADDLASLQIADAQRTLTGLSTSQSYPLLWLRWGRWLGLTIVVWALVVWIPVQYEAPTPLTAAERDTLLTQLTQPETPVLQKETQRARERLTDVRTRGEAQEALAELRGSIEEAQQAQTSERIAEIEALPVSDTEKQRLLAMVEQAGQLPEAQMQALLESLSETLPSEVAEQILPQLAELDAQRRASEALLADVRGFQHQLAGESQVTLQQDGEASEQTGQLGNGQEQVETLQPPGQTLVLGSDDDGSATITVSGEGAAPDEAEVAVTLPRERVLAAQEGFAEALMHERVPTRYREPIARYLASIAELAE